MNLNAQAYQQYKKTSVETLAPEKLLLMLYDGAIKDINNAINAIETDNLNLAHNEIIKTQDIIIELMSTLNMDYEISNSLFSLYDYIHRQLIQANIQKDIKILQEVQGFVTELRDTWQEAGQKVKTSRMPKAEISQGINIKG